MYTQNGFRITAIPEPPFQVFGLALADRESRTFARLPKFVLEHMPQLDFLGRRSVGGRVRFATDSRRILLRLTVDACREDINIPLTGSSGADIYLGTGEHSTYLGVLAPSVHGDREFTVEKVFSKGPGLDTVTVNLPRNDLLLGMDVGTGHRTPSSSMALPSPRAAAQTGPETPMPAR